MEEYYEVISHNSFIECIGEQTNLEVLTSILEEQMKLYARRNGERYETTIADLNFTYIVRERWLKHTIFICKDEYNKTKKEIFNEAAKWCEDWINKYLPLFNPYSPEEEAERFNETFVPLWKQLKNRRGAEQPNPEPETTAGKIASILKEPLKGAFDEPEHIDKIIEALAEYAEGKTPDCVENQKYNCKNIKYSSMDFYTAFKGLNKKIGLTQKKIAEVLHYFIYANDNSQNAIKKTAIVQNIKRKYSKVI